MKKMMLVLASVGVFASQASFAAADRKGEDCSGQVKLATFLYSSQNCFSA
jgi:hypothetical protein